MFSSHIRGLDRLQPAEAMALRSTVNSAQLATMDVRGGSALNNRQLWQRERRNVQVSDVVLVISEDTPRGQWPIGHVTEVFCGTDGHVRVVEVQVGERRFTRPITRLCSIVEH